MAAASYIKEVSIFWIDKMAVARRAFGPVDNKQYYTQWLKTNILFDNLFLSCLNQAPFKVHNDDTLVPTMVYLA